MTAAAEGSVKTMPDDFRVSITDASGKDAYPISGFTYLLISQDQTAAGAKGKALVKFLKWSMTNGQKDAEPLAYAPLPKPIVKKVEAKIASIKTEKKIMSKARHRKDVHFGDRIFAGSVKGLSFAIAGLLVLIAVFLWFRAAPAFQKFGFGFMKTSVWDPVQDEFGALPVIYGTIVSSLIAVVIATPLSIGIALFLNEIAPRRISEAVGFLVQMLAAIPSVVYGLWGIFVLAPWLRTAVEPILGKTLGFLPLFQGPPYGVGMLAAGIILAIMITPTISSISREVFSAVPRPQREAALALGATRLGDDENRRASFFDSWRDRRRHSRIGPRAGRNDGRDHGHRQPC